MDNDLNTLNNMSPSAAIYTNHDSNPTQKAENSRNEENRPVRKKFVPYQLLSSNSIITYS